MKDSTVTLYERNWEKICGNFFLPPNPQSNPEENFVICVPNKINLNNSWEKNFQEQIEEKKILFSLRSRIFFCKKVNLYIGEKKYMLTLLLL